MSLARCSWWQCGLFLLAAFLNAASLAAPGHGRHGDPVVTNLDDSGPGSLRDEIAAAQSGDSISFAVQGTIVLTNGELLIDKNLNITGPGATNLALSAGGQSRVFEIVSNTAVGISGLTICDGHAADGAEGTSNNPAGGDGSDGGGIYNAGSLRIEQCVISNCAAGKGGNGFFLLVPPAADATNWTGGAAGNGGAVYNAGQLLLNGTTLVSDSSGAGGNGGGSYIYGTRGAPGGNGGAIYNKSSLMIEQCTISNCVAGNGGNGNSTLPAIFNEANAEATNWLGGMGGQGGAIYNAGNLALNNSSLISNLSGNGGNGGGEGYYGAAGNSGGGGGAIYNAAVMSLRACAFERNVAGNGGVGLSGSRLSRDYRAAGNGGTGGNGGALCDVGQATVFISNCQFSSNFSGIGGSGNLISPDIFPAIGTGGGRGGGGGAIWAGAPMRVEDCTFLFNESGSGGSGGPGVGQSGGNGAAGGAGGAICALGELTLTRCLCASNHAAAGGDGGTSYIDLAGSGGSGGSGGAVFAASALRLNECIFEDNTAGPGGSGGTAGTSIYTNPTPGGGGAGGSGGAIYCESNLTAIYCTLDNNQTGLGARGGSDTYSYPGIQGTPSGTNGGDGGAIFGSGSMILYASTISGNRGGNGSPGGAGPLNSKISVENPAAHEDATPRPEFIASALLGGPGGPGGAGGIYSEGSLNMVLCTLSGNVGGAGGGGGGSWGNTSASGWFPDPGPDGGTGASGGTGAIGCGLTNQLVLIACTLAGNVGGAGGPGGGGESDYWNHTTGQGPGGAGGVGGISNTNGAASASIINTIIAANFGGTGGATGPWSNSVPIDGAPDVQGSFSSLGYNLIGATDESSGFTNGVNGDLVGSTNAPLDPVLGPLADNGGPTFTMALLHGSPALDAGDDALLQQPYNLKTDQRGFPRRSGSHVDIGAFEFQYRGHGPNFPGRRFILSGRLAQNSGLQANAAANDALFDAGARRTAPEAGALPKPEAAGGFQLSFNSSTPGATFSVLATTNLSLPVDKWTVLGQPIQTSPGVFQFIDGGATNGVQRFYRVSSP